MTIRIYQVDAFAGRLFSGNPAAICPLAEWLPDELLQNIAMENNLAETGFYVPRGDRYEIRWFTPAVEVDLCGHATLAAAYVIFNEEGFSGGEIVFHSHRSGELRVSRSGDWLTLDFPTDTFSEIPVTDAMTAALGVAPLEAYKGKTDYLLVLGSRSELEQLQPDLDKVSRMHDCRGLIVTAPGSDTDFVSRFFAPQSGIPEDPVTGSAHTTLTPYWSRRLGKTELTALQCSPRTGFLRCRLNGARTAISGQARLFMKGEIILPA